MRRLFPTVAGVVGLLLAMGFYSGLIRRGDDVGRGVRLASMGLAMVVHAWAFVYLWVAGRRVEAIVGREGWPEWVGAQAEKNRRKAIPFQLCGSLIAVVGVGLLVFEWWPPIVYGASVSFQVGFLIFESMIVANQSRLLEELSQPALASRAAEGP